jgi:hypothetical protein
MGWLLLICCAAIGGLTVAVWLLASALGDARQRALAAEYELQCARERLVELHLRGKP